MKSKIMTVILCLAVFLVSAAMVFRIADISKSGSGGGIDTSDENMTEDIPATDETDEVFTRDSVIIAAQDAESFIKSLAFETDKEYDDRLADITERLTKASAFLSTEEKDSDGATYFAALGDIFRDILETPFADLSSFSTRVSELLKKLDEIYPSAAAEKAEADTEHENKMHYPKFDTSPSGSFAQAMLCIFNQQRNKNDEISISFGGNLILGDNITDTSFAFESQYKEYGSTSFPLYGVSSVFSGDDLSIVNLENPLTSSSDMKDGMKAVKGDPSFAQMLASGSVEFALLSGPGIDDYKDQGISDTAKVLSDISISSATDTDEGRIAYYEAKGKKIAVITYNIISERGPFIDKPKAAIKTARDNGADLVICSFNWSAKDDSVSSLYATEVDTAMPKTARGAIDSGADLVIGSAPHVIMGMEKYEGNEHSGTIVYSPGDLSYSADKNTELADTQGFIFRQSFKFSEDGAAAGDIEIYPIKNTGAEGSFAPSLILDSSASSVADKIVKASNGINKKYKIKAENLNYISISK